MTNLPAAIAWARSYASDLEKSSKDVDLSLGMHDWCKEYAAHLRALVEAAEERDRALAMLERCAGVLENTYDAQDFPEDGTSNAEITAKDVRALLSHLAWPA